MSTLSPINIFFDSSALIAGIVSSQGAARALLLLAEDKRISITISEQVLVEVERNLARKAPATLPFAREIILAASVKIIRDPGINEIAPYLDWMEHKADVPILVAAMRIKTDFLVTHNTKHFVDDPSLAMRSKIQIGSPGDALNWVRSVFDKKAL